MRLATLISSSIIALCCLACPAKAAEPNRLTPEEIADGWILLFDGETMFGWTPNSEANWAVKDGIVSVSSGKMGLLCTNTEFGNYHLLCDFRAPKETNSGVFLRVPFKGENIRTNCYELNIAPPENPFPTGSYVARQKAKTVAEKAGEWQSFEATLDGAKSTIKLNGETVLEYTDPAPTGAGLIGLQLNTGAVEFKNIKLKPLDKAK